jgi:hypothetical protein
MGVGVGTPGGVVAVGSVGAVGVGPPAAPVGVVVRVGVLAVDVELLNPQASRVVATAKRASVRRKDAGVSRIGNHLSRAQSHKPVYRALTSNISVSV